MPEYSVTIVEAPTPQIDVMSFNGATSFLDVSSLFPADISTFGTGATMLMWAFPFPVSLDSCLVSYRNGTTPLIQLLIQNSSQRWRGVIRNDAGSFINNDDAVFTPNSWVHVALTYDPVGNFTFLIDGTVVAQNPTPGGSLTASIATIGATNSSGYFAFFGGVLRDVQIYDRPLSDAEVSSIYNAGSVGATAGTPYARYIDSEVDQSGNGRNAVNNNVSTTQANQF